MAPVTLTVTADGDDAIATHAGAALLAETAIGRGLRRRCRPTWPACA